MEVVVAAVEELLKTVVVVEVVPTRAEFFTPRITPGGRHPGTPTYPHSMPARSTGRGGSLVTNVLSQTSAHGSNSFHQKKIIEKSTNLL